jgi:hypothetical protein
MDEELAVNRFRELRQAGLAAVLISCSPFHAERIPPIRTMRAIQASLQVFGRKGTVVYLPDFIQIVQRFDLNLPTPLSRYEEEFGPQKAGQILWGGYGIISGGRAGFRLGHLVPHYAAATFAHENCAREILYAHHSHFDLYGNYISWFCGGLAVGDWHSLPQLLTDFRAGHYPPLIAMLIERGSYGLCEFAQEQYGYQPLPDGYTGKCHLCVDVRRHILLSSGEDYPELRPEGFYDNI